MTAIAAGELTDPLPGHLGTKRLKNIQRIDIRELASVRRFWPPTRTRLDDELLKIVAALHSVPPNLMPVLRGEAARRRRHSYRRLAASVVLPALIVAVGVYWLAGQLMAERVLARANRVTTAGQLLLRAHPMGGPRDEPRQTALGLAIFAVESLRRQGNDAAPDFETFLRGAASANSLLSIFEGSREKFYTGPITWSPDRTKLFAPAIGVVKLDGTVLHHDTTAAAWSRDGRMAFATRGLGPLLLGTRNKDGNLETSPYPVADLDPFNPVKWNSDLSRFAALGVQTTIGYRLHPLVIGVQGGPAEHSRPFAAPLPL